MPERTITLKDADRLHRVTVHENGTVQLEGEPAVPIAAAERGLFRIGDPPRNAWALLAGTTCWVFLDGEVHTFEVERDGARKRRQGRHHDSLTAPMPATVIRIQTQVGAAVTRGETLVILEAMKMELPVRASEDGVVTAVNCREGDLVQPGASLVEID